VNGVELVVYPRAVLTWAQFVARAPSRSIALDGMVAGGPRWDEVTMHANFDHHDGVVREATMSTAMQVLFAIKGGLMERLGGRAQVWVNDPDQDTSLASWLLVHHAQFDGVQSHPVVSRLLALTDRLDVTGGAYPMRLDDDLLAMHAWVFEPYAELRASGALATADTSVVRNCLDAVHARLDAVRMGQAGRRVLRTDVVVLHDSPRGYQILDERGGNEARYALFARGLRAYVALVARRPDGRFVYTIGRRSRYVDFPVAALYEALNRAEVGLDAIDRWGGSDIIGGSPRRAGSGLTWERVRDVIDSVPTCMSVTS